MKRSNQNRYLTRRKLFRAIFGVFSLSGILFAFQACYGTPQDFGMDVLISGKVISALDKTPLSGIKVSLQESGQYTSTDDDGTYSVYCERLPAYQLKFSDIDGAKNGSYQGCDTTVQSTGETDSLVINIELK